MNDKKDTPIKIDCPYCRQRTTLQNRRPVWITGNVVEIHDDQGNSCTTIDEEESSMDDGPLPDHYCCGDCGLWLSRDTVLDQVFPGE